MVGILTIASLPSFNVSAPPDQIAKSESSTNKSVPKPLV